MSRDDSDSSSRRHRRSHRHGDSSRFAKERDLGGAGDPLSRGAAPGATGGQPTDQPLLGGSDQRAAAVNPVEQFRGPSKRLAIHPLENALLWVVGAHLVILPWALGTVRLPAQIISLVLSSFGFLLCLLPRNYTAEHTGGPSIRLSPVPRLLKFPIFWFGLGLLGLIVIQALNPAWEYQSNGKLWWMRRVSYATWLPHGVRAPFTQPPGIALFGPWRMLVIYASAFFTVCAIWVGFTRRRTLQRLFLVLAANAVALSIFGLAQRLLGSTKIFGFIDSVNPLFFSSFIYKNHAGAYLFLGLSIACGLGGWYYVRGVRRLEKSSPAGLFAFFMTCIAVSVLVSYARGATLTMLVYLCVVVAVFIYYQWRLPAVARSPVITIALLLVFGFFLKTGMTALHSELAWDRLRQAFARDDLAIDSRETAFRASWDMFRDYWGLGAGSGSFPFVFPKYQQYYPSIATHQFWPHVHNDVLEIPLELGIPGMLLIVPGFAFWALVLLRNYAWENPLSSAVILGCVSLIGMSLGDFYFYCPAVLITWCALWPAAARWAELEEQRTRG